MVWLYTHDETVNRLGKGSASDFSRSSRIKHVFRVKPDVSNNIQRLRYIKITTCVGVLYYNVFPKTILISMHMCFTAPHDIVYHIIIYYIPI